MFTLKSIGIFDGQTGEELFSPEQTEEGAYTFPMPDRSVTVRGTFVQITEEKESEAAEDGTGTEEGTALGSVQMNAAGAYAAARSGSTSSQLRAKIGRIRVFSDSSEQIKTYNEGMLGVDGKAAFCLNPLVNFQSGSVTAVNLLEYGLKQSDITACALYIKYVYEHTELTDNQKI